MFDRSYRLRQVLEENEKDYKKLIDITNQKWDAYEQSIGSVYLQAEMNDQSRFILILIIVRISFCKQTLFTIIKIMTEKDNEVPIIGYYEEKFKDIE